MADDHRRTGDATVVGNAIGEQINIPIIHGDLLPGDKVKYVETYQQAGCKVAMIGDGISSVSTGHLQGLPFGDFRLDGMHGLAAGRAREEDVEQPYGPVLVERVVAVAALRRLHA